MFASDLAAFLAHPVVASVASAFVLGTASVAGITFLRARDNAREVDALKAELKEIREDLAAVPDLRAVIGELRAGFEGLKAAFERSADATREELRFHGEELSFIAGQLEASGVAGARRERPRPVVR